MKLRGVENDKTELKNMCYPNNTVEYRNAMDTENETISQYNKEVNQIHFYIWLLSTSAIYISVFLCYYSIKLTKKVSVKKLLRSRVTQNLFKLLDSNKEEKSTIE